MQYKPRRNLIKPKTMKAKKNKTGEYTLYEVRGRDISEMAEALARLTGSLKEAGVTVKGDWLGEEVIESYIIRDRGV